MNTTVETLAANGSTTALDWIGGDGTVFASGTFGGGSVTLQMSIDGGVAWFTALDADGAALALTTAGAFSFSVGSCKVRGVLAAATAPSINISIQER